MEKKSPYIKIIVSALLIGIIHWLLHQTFNLSVSYVTLNLFIIIALYRAFVEDKLFKK